MPPFDPFRCPTLRQHRSMYNADIYLSVCTLLTDTSEEERQIVSLLHIACISYSE